MKVLLLGENRSTHIQKWIIGLSGVQSIDLHVVTFKGGPELAGVKYSYLKKFLNNKADYLLNLWHFKRLIEQIRPNIVHAHYATSYGFLGAFSNFHPFIVTGWGADIFDSPANPVLKYFLRYTFRKADAITVLSEITRTEMVKLTSKQVDLIPFGVDIDKFSPRSEMRNPDQGIRIGTIRTLSEKYGVIYLLEAFARLSSDFSNIHLDIVGDGPLRQELEERATQLGVSEKVTFYGFINQNTDFQTYIKLLHRFDIFAILSVLDSETFGVASVEASACGIPVVASRVGGLPEVVEDNRTGIIVEPRDIDSTASALRALIENRELRLKLGEAGVKNVKEKYDWKKNVAQMVSLYYNTIEMKREI